MSSTCEDPRDVEQRTQALRSVDKGFADISNLEYGWGPDVVPVYERQTVISCKE
jgi:hypothetical protein